MRIAALSSKCAVHDVQDAEAFVKAAIHRSKIRFDLDEYEELVACGLLLLVELAQRYDPEKDKGPRASFAGYAWYLLPRKLADAWHGLHEEHMLRTGDDGKRRWVYAERAKSWDAHVVGDEQGEGTFDERKLRHVGDFVA